MIRPVPSAPAALLVVHGPVDVDVSAAGAVAPEVAGSTPAVATLADVSVWTPAGVAGAFAGERFHCQMIITALKTANAMMALLTLSFFFAAGFPFGCWDRGMGMAFAAVAFVFFTKNPPCFYYCSRRSFQ
jgi:hypothetical protein